MIRGFLDADLLPRVVTGTSAGGLIAALVCTHTNAELKQLIRPELADKITACEDPFATWVRRWWRTGARFSAVSWARKAMFFTHGSMTFKEAYERTGRALNVSVVPADRYSPTILLNHLTAPNCTIWSAIIASAAVPGILNPVVLMSKARDGTLKPHNLGGSRFKDGSLREDIPLGSLHTQFNCNFSIVSQTNPHIHLFFFAPRGKVGRPVAHRKGKGWRGGFILSALESYIKLDLSKHFKVIRDLDLMPQLLQSDWSGVFLQRFSGDLTLTPRSTVRDWFHLLDDPDRAQLERMIRVGQRVTWPSLHMAGNRMLIERSIQRGRQECRLAASRDRPTTDQTEPSTPRDRLQLQIPIESDADNAIRLRERQKHHRGAHAHANGSSALAPAAAAAAAGAGEDGTLTVKRRRGRRLRDARESRESRDSRDSLEPPTPHANPVHSSAYSPSGAGHAAQAAHGAHSPAHSRSQSVSSPLSPRRFTNPFNFASFAKRRNSRSTMSIARWFAGSSSESESDLPDDDDDSDPLDMDADSHDAADRDHDLFDEAGSSQLESDGPDAERQRASVSQDI